MKTLKNSIETVLAPPIDWQSRLLRSWPTIVGPLAQRMRIEKISGSQLFIGVYDSHWLTELHCMSPLIISTINDALKEKHITHIRLRLARTKRHDNYKITTEQKEVLCEKPLRLNTQQEQALTNLKDQELQATLCAYFVRCNKSTPS